jgi:hypothetical protein
MIADANLTAEYFCKPTSMAWRWAVQPLLPAPDDLAGDAYAFGQLSH